MASEFRTKRRVEFAETDAAGILHFSNYFRYMEEAEHAFLRSLGHSVEIRTPEGLIGFPRLAVSCEYLKPVKFEDVLDLHLWVRRKGRTSITYAVVFRKDGVDVARGETTAVACLVRPDRTIQSIPLPPELAAKLEEAPYPPFPRREPGGKP